MGNTNCNGYLEDSMIQNEDYNPYLLYNTPFSQIFTQYKGALLKSLGLGHIARE